MLFANFFFYFIFITGIKGQESAEVISYNTSYRVDNGTVTERIEAIIQINDKDGADLADVSIPFTSKNQISDIQGQIEDAYGNVVRKLKKRDITEASSISNISLYEDNRVKQFSLRHSSYPYTIKYSYNSLATQHLHIADWHPVLDPETPIKQATLELDVPVGYAYKISQHLVDEPKKQHEGDRVKTVWTVSYEAKDGKREAYSPPHVELFPRVLIVPEKFEFGLTGSFESWSTYGSWLKALSEGLHDLPQREKNKVRDLTAGITDPKEKVRVLYHHMQDNTRYINVAIGIGGMKPYPASYVVSNQYGDCKALTNYMQALLKEAGIDSYSVDIYAGETPWQFDETTPSQVFNHVILAVPMGKDTLWLENTSNTSPFAYLGSFTQNRKALWVDGPNSQIIQVPALQPEETGRTHEMNIQIKNSNSISAVVTSEYLGTDFEVLRYLWEEDNDDFMRAIHERHPYTRASFDGLRVVKRDRDNRKFSTIVQIDLESHTRTFGNTTVLFLPSVRVPGFEKPDQRTQPVLLPSPIRQEEVFTVKGEDGHTPLMKVESSTINSAFGYYELNTENTADGLKIRRKFVLYAGRYTLKDYTEFYGFLEKVREEERKTFIEIKST